jgi:hypothetical protein
MEVQKERIIRETKEEDIEKKGKEKQKTKRSEKNLSASIGWNGHQRT